MISVAPAAELAVGELTAEHTETEIEAVIELISTLDISEQSYLYKRLTEKLLDLNLQLDARIRDLTDD